MRNTGGKSLATSAAGVLGVLFTLLLGIVFASALGALPSSGAHAIEAPPSDPVATEHADQGIEVTRKITKVTGDPSLPAQAGDVLQYHVAVTNVSGAAFTAADPLVFSTNVSGLESQGHVQGVHAGTDGTTYCGPTAWRISGTRCASVAIDESGSAHVSTALAAGATYYFNVRVQIGNEFAGDLTLTHDFCLGTVASREVVEIR